jgi:hypothetical protein
MFIKWGKGSAFMFGRIEGDDSHRVERNRTADGKRWKFMVSDSITYRYVDDREFHTKEELESAVYEWIKNRKTNENI